MLRTVTTYLPDGTELLLLPETSEEYDAVKGVGGLDLDSQNLLTLCQVMLAYGILAQYVQGAGSDEAKYTDGQMLAVAYLPEVEVEAKAVETPVKEKYTVADFKANLASKWQWAERGITTLLRFQTESEKENMQTTESNKVGFNGVDAEILTSFANHIEKKRRMGYVRDFEPALSEKQLKIAFKKMPKYAKQLHKIAYGTK